MALGPCLIGYGEIAKRLHADPRTKREENVYWKWIKNYVEDDYQEAVEVGRGVPSTASTLDRADYLAAILERGAALQSPSRIEELVKIFVHATKVRSIREC